MHPLLVLSMIVLVIFGFGFSVMTTIGLVYAFEENYLDFFDMTPRQIMGEEKIVMIKIEWPDFKHDPQKDHANEAAKLFEEFFAKESYGKYNVKVTVLPKWYTMPNQGSYYSGNEWDFKIIPDVYSEASKDYDLSTYDKIWIIHAAPHFDFNNWPVKTPCMWCASYKTPVKINGVEKRFTFTSSPQILSDGAKPTMHGIHEFSHLLLKLPDLYYPQAHVWDPMALSGGDIIPGFSSWSKLQVGWLDEKNVVTVLPNDKRVISVKPLGLGPDGVLVIKIPVTQKIYYLIEVREPVGTESNIKIAESWMPEGYFKTGVFVLRVDENWIRETVQWIYPKSGKPAVMDEAYKSAFSVGESFTDPYFGEMTVKAKSGDSYEIEVDRTNVSFYHEEEFIIKTDKEIYTDGDTIVFSGKAPQGYDVANVWLRIYAPSGNEYAPGTYPNTDGTFQFTQPIYESLKEPAVLKVKAHYAGWLKEFTIKLNPRETQQQSQILSLNTDKQNYSPGETVLVSGAISKVIIIPGTQLHYSVYSDSLASKEGEVTPNADGTFSFKIYTQQNYPHEKFTIGVYYESGGATLGSATTSFNLGPISENISDKIPNWIKNNAKWWADKQIGDADFVQGIQYLVTQEIIKIPETKAGSGTSQEIPTWIRNNAKWWADGQISDDDFISGIQYLISSGIMKV